MPTLEREMFAVDSQQIVMDSQSSRKQLSISTTGKILLGLTGGIGIGLSVICIPFVSPAFRKYCLPYVPATTKQIENVSRFLQGSSKNKLLDIGSGDGRIVIAAAQKGLLAHGVELNTWLVQYSRFSALRHGVFNRTNFFRKDLWKFDVSPYKYVVIFGVEQMMSDLEKKLLSEVSNNTKIIACRFPLPSLVPTETIGDGVDTVWLYEIRQGALQNHPS